MNANPRRDKTSINAIPIHPILMAIYFVMALLGLNISQVFPQEALRSLLVVLLFSGLTVILMQLVFKDWRRGAFAASLLLVLYFTYGHVYNFLEKSIPGLGRHRLLLPVWVFLAVLGLWLIARRLKNPIVLTKALNAAALVALVFPIYQVIHWEISLVRSGENPAQNIPGFGNLHLDAGQTSPDVYFFVLDMYARQDVLQEVYNFDNSAFLNELKQMGFDVIECSQSNYSQTEMVLTSMLNMNYLDVLGQFDPSTTDPLALRPLIKDNSVMQAFKDLGYKLVSFETGFHFSEFHNVDYYLYPGDVNIFQFGGMNTFELMLFKSTAGLVLFDSAKTLPSFLVPDASEPLERKRQQILFDLHELKTIPQSISGPKFVFAHILVLHEPFVFSSTGNAVNYPEAMDKEQYQAGYRNQLEYVNNQLLPILQQMIENSNPKPIIILQGDTGPGLASHPGRMSNLSAFYFPGYAQSLSETFTPVNDFRLVFDHYFGAALDLLPDHSYFSLYTSPFELELVPNTCKTGYP